MATVIAVTGGKGGTGKSTVSVALSYALSKSYKVLLVDADVECPDDHIITGINLKDIRKVNQMLPVIDNSKCIKCGECAKVCYQNAIVFVEGNFPFLVENQCSGCNACLLKCNKIAGAISSTKKEIGKIEFGGNNKISLMTGILNINQEEATPVVNELMKEMNNRKDNYDYVIIDTAPGIHCNVISVLSEADYAIAVTEPTRLGIHDVSLILKLFEELKLKSGVLVNKSGIGEDKEIELLAENFNSRILVRIPYSKEIQIAYSKSMPIRNRLFDELAGAIPK